MENTSGPGVLTAIITQQFSSLSSSGGKQLTGVTAGGKSFTYQVPAGMEIDKLMGFCLEALRIYNGTDADGLARYFTRRPARTTFATF